MGEIAGNTCLAVSFSGVPSPCPSRLGQPIPPPPAVNSINDDRQQIKHLHFSINPNCYLSSTEVITLSRKFQIDMSSYSLGGSISGWYSSLFEPIVPKLSFWRLRRACSFFLRSLFIPLPNYNFFCSYRHCVFSVRFSSLREDTCPPLETISPVKLLLPSPSRINFPFYFSTNYSIASCSFTNRPKARCNSQTLLQKAIPDMACRYCWSHFSQKSALVSSFNSRYLTRHFLHVCPPQARHQYLFDCNSSQQEQQRLDPSSSFFFVRMFKTRSKMSARGSSPQRSCVSFRDRSRLKDYSV